MQAVKTNEDKITQVKEEADRVKSKVTALNDERKELERRIKDMRSQAERFTKDEVAAQENLRAAVTSVEEAKATMTAQQQSGPKGRSMELTKLMEAAKKGGPLEHAGLRGRLGDLGNPLALLAYLYSLTLSR
jgi:septal ring factor EnvC (AmiA/AmiB activator)